MIEYSNFRLTEIKGSSVLNYRFYALIDVTTKRLFRKPVVETREISRTFAGFWHFRDSGEFVTGNDVKALERAFEADQGKDIEFCKATNSKR